VNVEFTTIQITTGTRDKLKSLRIVKRESYEEIICRLLKEHGEKK